MNYQVLIIRRAQKELSDLRGDDYDRVVAAIAKLAANPRPNGSKKLVGRDGWRIRIGDTRVIYEIGDAKRTVTILSLGNRRDIYR